jgi:hypothetical protein
MKEKQSVGLKARVTSEADIKVIFVRLKKRILSETESKSNL